MISRVVFKILQVVVLRIGAQALRQAMLRARKEREGSSEDQSKKPKD